jgi:hypothetical protein
MRFYRTVVRPLSKCKILDLLDFVFSVKLNILFTDNWFKHLHGVLKKYNLFNRPEALWNADEAGFTDDPGRRSVVIKRSTKHATSSQSGTGKSHTTLLICTSASGE